MTQSVLDQFAAAANTVGLPLTSHQLDLFAAYAEELTIWNQRINLTALHTAEEIYIRHFLDSLTCALHWGTTPKNLIDVGTGAGFPGIPLKILRPGMQLTLVESVTKKARFLEHIVSTFGLQDVQVVPLRAEEIGNNSAHRERYDVAVARAVADLRILAEYLLPLVRVGGRMLAPKGAAAANEAESARNALHLLGGKAAQLAPVKLPGRDAHTMIVIEKRRPTPRRFPRQNGIPSRKPL